MQEKFSIYIKKILKVVKENFQSAIRFFSNCPLEASIKYTQHTGDSFVEPPDLFLCPWYLVTWSLYQCTLRIVSLLPAEDEDLSIYKITK